MEADVNFLETIKKTTVKDCTEICKKRKKCDFFVYMHFKMQCDLLEFKRRSFVVEIGLTSDAIFCIKPSTNDLFLNFDLGNDSLKLNHYIFRFGLNI